MLHLRDDGTIDPVGPGMAITASSTRIGRLVCPPDQTAGRGSGEQVSGLDSAQACARISESV